MRVQQQTRDEGGSGRVLLKGPPEALRLIEGYSFAEDGRAVTLAGVRLAPPPDGARRGSPSPNCASRQEIRRARIARPTAGRYDPAEHPTNSDARRPRMTLSRHHRLPAHRPAARTEARRRGLLGRQGGPRRPRRDRARAAPRGLAAHARRPTSTSSPRTPSPTTTTCSTRSRWSARSRLATATAARARWMRRPTSRWRAAPSARAST